MLIHIFAVASSATMMIAKAFENDGKEFIVWACILFYALINWSEHQLRGSKFDY